MALKLSNDFVVLFLGDSTQTENEYTRYLKEENIKGRIIPTLSFHFKNKEDLKKSLCTPDCYSGIIFTSVRAVSICSLLLSSSQTSYIEQWQEKKNFSVGETTADHALSLLDLDTLGSDSGNSENLCELIVKQCGHLDKPLLFPCSSIRKDTIPTRLFEKNIPIKEIACYETTPNEQFVELWQNLIEKEGWLPNILIFFSPSGVKFCIDVIKNTYKEVALPKFIAIGPSTEKALLEVGISCKVADKPSAESIVHCVKDLLDT